MDKEKLKNSMSSFAHKVSDVSKELTEKTIDFSKDSAVKVKDAALVVKDKSVNFTSKEVKKIKEKKEIKKSINFKTVDSLQQVVNVINEAASALNDSSRTIKESAIPETLSGVLGASIGGTISFAALYGLGTVGFSAVGITTGLAGAGALVGGGMVSGIFVLAAPIAALAGVGVFTASQLKSKQLRKEKDRLYKEALRKHDAIINALKKEVDATNERLDYLNSLNILLKQAIKDLKYDLDVNVS